KAIDGGQPSTRGIVLSLVGDAIDLAVAAEATPEFTHIGDRGEYNFRVFERIALRIKDNNAIIRLDYKPVSVQAARTELPTHSRTTVTVTLVDEAGNPRSGEQVSLSPSSPTTTVTPQTQTTNASGHAT